MRLKTKQYPGQLLTFNKHKRIFHEDGYVVPSQVGKEYYKYDYVEIDNINCFPIQSDENSIGSKLTSTQYHGEKIKMHFPKVKVEVNPWMLKQRKKENLAPIVEFPLLKKSSSSKVFSSKNSFLKKQPIVKQQREEEQKDEKLKRNRSNFKKNIKKNTILPNINS